MTTNPCSGVRALAPVGPSGIGQARTELLAARGASVVVLDRDGPPAEMALPAILVDVADEEAVRQAAAKALGVLKGLDVLVSNADIAAKGTAEENPDDEWRRVFGINVFAIVGVSRAGSRTLADSAHAAIVNTCSNRLHNGARSPHRRRASSTAPARGAR